MPSQPPDRFIYAPAERKPAVLELIRRAERRITLSLFRCNDADVFAELAAAVSRGVGVDVLVTAHAKGGGTSWKSSGAASTRRALAFTGTGIQW